MLEALGREHKHTCTLASTAGTAIKVTDHDDEVMRCAGTCEEHVCLSQGNLVTRPSSAPTSLWGETTDQLLADHLATDR